MQAIVYRTENLLNHKFYYGVHNGAYPLYLGSGTILKKAIKKYGRDNFIRRTVMKFSTVEEAYIFEGLIVDEDMVRRDDCYNVALGGINTSGFRGRKHTKESRGKISIATAGERNPFYGKKHSKETKKKLKGARPNIAGKNNPFYGKKHSEETKKKMSIRSENQPYFTCGCGKVVKGRGNYEQHLRKCQNIVNNERHTIKCSRCDKTFPGGYEYRIHWEKHLDEFLKIKQRNK